VVLWGRVSQRRKLMHVDDLAEAALLLMREDDSPEIINVGTGESLTIREIAEHWPESGHRRDVPLVRRELCRG